MKIVKVKGPKWWAEFKRYYLLYIGLLAMQVSINIIAWPPSIFSSVCIGIVIGIIYMTWIWRKHVNLDDKTYFKVRKSDSAYVELMSWHFRGDRNSTPFVWCPVQQKVSWNDTDFEERYCPSCRKDFSELIRKDIDRGVKGMFAVYL